MQRAILLLVTKERILVNLSATEIWALAVFVIVYFFIVSELIHRTVIALLGAAILVMSGILTQAKAISYVDFNTIGLLAGMMIIVNITAETGLFNFMAMWSAQKVKARPVWLMGAMALLTAVCSGFLDNVTTVLLTVPVTFVICKKLEISVYPFLMVQIMASNIGGTATMIGDPPNIMLSSAVPELNFMAFLTNLAAICLVILVVVFALLAFIYRKSLRTTDELRAKVMEMNAKSQITNVPMLRKCLFVLVLVIAGFIFHDFLHADTATIALCGASLLMLLTMARNEKEISRALAGVEWVALFFFIGLFVIIGGLVETGTVTLMAKEAMKATGGDVTMTTMLVLWLSAIASAFIDNIPFVATMIPLIKDMGSMGITNLDPLWWALSLGACLGGNGTLIGASANVVVASLAQTQGIQMTFRSYTKIGFPMMVLSILISMVYVYVRYLA